jgi:predicted acyltransferase
MNTGNPAPARNKLATTSLVVGIFALLFAIIFLYGLFGALLGIVSIVIGFVALKQIKAQGTTGKGLATAGIVLGVVTLIWSFIFVPLVLGPIIGDVFSTINASLSGL